MEFTVHQWEVSMHVLRSFFPRGKSLSLWLLTLGLLLLGAIHSEANTNVSFTLPAGQPSYLTSAAVYSASGVMVRHLWKYVSYAPGAQNYVWDDKDDAGNILTGNYTIKVLHHNVNYIWDGAIGNTSQDQSGWGVHRIQNQISDIAITGTKAMYASTNFEGVRDYTTFDTTAPGVVTQKIALLGATNYNPKQAQVTGVNGGASVPVVANLAMNFTGGTTGKVHIIWGGFTQNTRGGAKLTVVDNTSGAQFTSPAYPDLAFEIDYNGQPISSHTVFSVGDCRSMTISVVDNNIWNQCQRAYIQAVWVENGGGTAVTTYQSTLSQSFDRFADPGLTYTVNSCNVGGTWLLPAGGSPIFSTTRNPLSGFSLTIPAVGGGTDIVAKCDFNRAGLYDDCDAVDNTNNEVAVSQFVATDGVWYYGATASSYDNTTNMAGLIIPMWADNYKQAYFLNGARQVPYAGYSYNFLPNAIRVGTQQGLSGIAVQTSGNILAASVAPDNLVYLFDKRTGAQLKTIAVTAPGRLAMTPDGDLWVVTGTSVVRYTNLSGIPSIATTITGLSKPLAVAVSPLWGDDTVIVADGATSMQLKAYTNAGAYKWTYGQLGGYQSNGPVVTNDKFWFINDGFGTRAQNALITFQPDGTFWVGDGGNYRVLHFSADRSQVLGTIMCKVLEYNMAVDPNTPTRVTGNFLEFQVDYTKPIAGNNGSWTLMNNYGANVADCYWNGGYFPGFIQVITFPQNGRKYGTLARQDLWHKIEIVELTTTGIRPTGILLDGRFSILEANGTITQDPLFNNTWVQQTVTGFDVNGNPQYSAATQIASAPMGATDPADGGKAAISDTGVVAALEGSLAANKFHLGGVQTGTNVWAWRAEPAVPTASYEAGLNFGDFDIGDGVNYPANTVIAKGRQIVNDYHGEFYKQSQAGQFMHHLDNGLFVGQFGSSGLMPNGQRWPFGGNVLAGFAGNNFAIKIVSYNNELYVWTNDESSHGPQRWHLSNLNSINVLYGSGTVGGTITAGTTEAKSIVAAPSFSPVAGTFASTQNLTISSTTAGATIRYTTDGSTPSATNGAIYTSPVAIAVTTTLKAIAYKLEMADSTVTSGVYTINCVAPTFSPVAGTYSSAQTVTISCATSGVTMRYTTDGSTPSQTVGTVYSTPVSISVTCTLKAIAFNTGMTDSTIASGLYTINLSGPTYQAVGTVASGTGAITPTWPTHQAGDVALLVIESANQAISLSTPAGFVEVTGSPQGTGTAGGTAATRLAVYWKRATTSSESSPTVADSGDHQIARIITFRGVIGSGNPWDVTAGGVAASASTAVSIPGATTTVANTLVVTIVANGTDTTSAQTSGWTNANLTSLTERMDNNTSSGNGGGFGVATGVKATAGAYGATTATLATSSVQGKLSIALKPAA